jgi:hypothetical protein
MLDNEATSIWTAGVLGRRPERVLDAMISAASVRAAQLVQIRARAGAWAGPTSAKHAQPQLFQSQP